MNPCDNCKKKPNCPERCFPKMDYERGQKKIRRNGKHEQINRQNPRGRGEGTGGDGMSVIIHGLNMPKSCDECRLFNESWCMALGVENWRKSYNKPPEGGRLPDCPLVPLPEGHGRLGDLDALQEEFKKSHDGKRLMLIDTAPTIVPAEGGTDDV